jgi:hypothetical protein
MRVEGRYLYIDAHEWASSVRQSGFPCTFYASDGTPLGEFETSKYAKRIAIPEGAAWLVRRYRTNSGALWLWVYSIPDLKCVAHCDAHIKSGVDQLPNWLQQLLRDELYEEVR